MKSKTFLSTLALLGAAAAQAHVSLEEPQALAGASYKAVLRVGHGCEGTATHTVVVRVPAGFRGAKPMPKAGWVLSIDRAPLAEPYESHGRKISDDVVQITWKAASKEAFLADAYYDEFVLRGPRPPPRPAPLGSRFASSARRASGTGPTPPPVAPAPRGSRPLRCCWTW